VKYAFLCGGSALAVAASLCAPQAFAATAADTAAANAETPSVIGELVVVAEKREENIESVPVAVTAFSAKQRSLMGIKSIQDVSDYTPGLAYNSIANRPYIRGIGRNTDNLATASAVAIYYDGVYDGANANTILQKDDLFIANVEVDRGPQNTLHGSNSDGGVINFVSQKPTSSFYAEGRAGFGNLDTEYGEAVVSGPIADNWRIRIGGNYTNQGGGSFHNFDGSSQGGTLPQGNSGRTYYGEIQLQGSFGKFDAWGKLSSGEYDTNYHTVATTGNIPTQFQLNGTFAPSNFYGLCAPNLITAANTAACAFGGQAAVLSATTDSTVASQFPGNNPTNVDPRNFIQEFTSTNHERNDIAFNGTLTYHFPGADLTYLVGYQSFNYDLNFTTAADSGVTSFQVAGAPNTPLAVGTCAFLTGVANAAGCTQPLTIHAQPDTTLFDENDSFFSHELDLTSTSSSPLQYVGGLYWYHEHYDQPVSAGVMPTQTQFAHPMYLGPTITGGCPGGAVLCAAPINPTSAVSTSDTFLTYDSYAAFANLTYKFNDAWKINGGLRYTDDVKSGYQLWRFETFDVQSGFQSQNLGANTPALDFSQVAVGANATTAYPGAGLAFLQSDGNWRRNLSASWSALTGQAGVDWTPNADTLAYFKYSRGYKSGGFSTFTIAANPETKAETVDAFEIGGKEQLGRTLTANVAAFYYLYDNDQIPLSVQNAQGLIASQLFNLKSVHIYGAEFEGDWRPIDPLTLSLQYSYLSAKVANAGACFEDTVDPLAQQPGANTAGCANKPGATAVVQNLNGEYLPEAAPNKVSLNGLYVFRFDPGNLTLSASFIWKDATYGSIFNRPYSLAPSYSQVNLRATWASADGRYNIIAFGNNVFNTVGYDGQTGLLLESAGASSTGQEMIVRNPSLTAPTTYGIEFQYRFK
jgi:iron complex outermembrane receptor protein